MSKSTCIQCWVPKEIVHALDVVRSKDFRSRSSLMTHYLINSLQAEAQRMPEVDKILKPLWEGTDDCP